MFREIGSRFNAKWEPITESGCWIWMGANRRGYGQIKINNKNIYAHRVSYMMYKGRIGKGIHVCHTCDIPECVNPDHLFLGTAKDNFLDMVRKGRSPTSFYGKFGEKNPQAKLCAEDVIFIRQSKIPASELAIRFNVSISNITAIRRRDQWKHI